MLACQIFCYDGVLPHVLCGTCLRYLSELCHQLHLTLFHLDDFNRLLNHLRYRLIWICCVIVGKFHDLHCNHDVYVQDVTMDTVFHLQFNWHSICN